MTSNIGNSNNSDSNNSVGSSGSDSTRSIDSDLSVGSTQSNDPVDQDPAQAPPSNQSATDDVKSSASKVLGVFAKIGKIAGTIAVNTLGITVGAVLVPIIWIPLTFIPAAIFSDEKDPSGAPTSRDLFKQVDQNLFNMYARGLDSVCKAIMGEKETKPAVTVAVNSQTNTSSTAASPHAAAVPKLDTSQHAAMPQPAVRKRANTEPAVRGHAVTPGGDYGTSTTTDKHRARSKSDISVRSTRPAFDSSSSSPRRRSSADLREDDDDDDDRFNDSDDSLTTQGVPTKKI
jgi:hypothetical protein